MSFHVVSVIQADALRQVAACTALMLECESASQFATSVFDRSTHVNYSPNDWVEVCLPCYQCYHRRGRGSNSTGYRIGGRLIPAHRFAIVFLFSSSVLDISFYTYESNNYIVSTATFRVFRSYPYVSLYYVSILFLYQLTSGCCCNPFVRLILHSKLICATEQNSYDCG